MFIYIYYIIYFIISPTPPQEDKARELWNALFLRLNRGGGGGGLPALRAACAGRLPCPPRSPLQSRRGSAAGSAPSALPWTGAPSERRSTVRDSGGAAALPSSHGAAGDVSRSEWIQVDVLDVKRINPTDRAFLEPDAVIHDPIS